MNESGEKAYASRICDTLIKSVTNISPIQGYEKAPLVSLEKAVQPLESIVPRIQNMVYTVMFNCKNPPDNLSPDESASIMLYTLSWIPEDKSFYYILNSTLRTEDQASLKPWYLYLKLVITALSKIPSERRFLYRGLKKNMAEEFEQEKTFFWWMFTSCTTSVKVLESELFLGKTGKRTMFTIDCWSGKYIRKHSMVKKEEEVLLLPGFQFKVVATLDAGNDLHMIQIQEIDLQHSLLEPSDTSITPVPTKPLPSIFPKKTHSYTSYHNATLEQAIQKCQSRKLNLSGQPLNDQDVVIVSERGVIEKQLKILDLMCTGIKQQGVSILSNAIRDSQFLEELNISHNSISDLGVQYLASVINSSALKRIDLSENDISDEGARCLAEMLETNTKLIQLSLSENQIGNDGMKMLTDVLNRGNTTLEVFNLSANTGINDESIGTLLDMIKHNQSLKKLDLRHCDFSEDGQKELQVASKLRKKFELWLSHTI
jgi:hypothetical protein